MDIITQSFSNSWDYFIQLLSNPLAFFLVIILPIAAFIFAYRSVPQKVLVYFTTDNRLITNKQYLLENLSIYYNGQPVENLTVTTVTFWNNSFPTINSNDISDKDPLRIFLKDGEILSVSVLKGAYTANCIDVTLIDDQNAFVSFDYLDRKEGGIIQVVHTGYDKEIYMSQKLKGGKIKSYISTSIFFSICFILSSIFLIVSIFLNEYPLNIFVQLVATILIYICIYIIMINPKPKFIPKNCKIK